MNPIDLIEEQTFTEFKEVIGKLVNGETVSDKDIGSCYGFIDVMAMLFDEYTTMKEALRYLASIARA